LDKQVVEVEELLYQEAVVAIEVDHQALVLEVEEWTLGHI
jgi:hypothetical protein